MKHGDCESCEKGGDAAAAMMMLALYACIVGALVGGIVVAKFGAALAAGGW